MFLTIKVMLVLAGVEALPDHLRVQVLLPRLTGEMTDARVFRKLRLENPLQLPLNQPSHRTYAVPLGAGKDIMFWFEYSLPAKGWTLQKAYLWEDAKGPIISVEYGKK